MVGLNCVIYSDKVLEFWVFLWNVLFRVYVKRNIEIMYYVCCKSRKDKFNE